MGAFSEGFALGGSMYDSSERMKLAKEEHAWKKKEQDDKAALAKIYGEVQAQGDTRTEAIPGSEYASDVGPAIQTKAVPITTADRVAQIQQRAGAAGIDPMLVQQAVLGHYQVASAGRSERQNAKVEEFQNWNADVAEKMAKGDYVGIIRDNISLYNKPKKGSMADDGHTADVIPSADGKAFSFVQKDKDGNIVSSTPITKEAVEAQIDKIAFMKYQSLDFKGAKELGFKGREVGAKEEANAIDREFKGKGGVYERMHMADIGSRAAIAKASASKPHYTLVGQDSDGTPVRFNSTDGSLTRQDGKQIQDQTLFKKITGGNATDPMTAKLVESYAREIERAKPDQIPAIQKKYAGLGVNTGYVDQTGRALPKPGGNLFGGNSSTPTGGNTANTPRQNSALPLGDRVSNAFQQDNERGGRYYVTQLENEAERALPQIDSAIKVLESNISKMRPNEQKAAQTRIVELQNDRQIYQGLIDQRKARSGY